MLRPGTDSAARKIAATMDADEHLLQKKGTCP
jgi:hypothetical protein